ncbi:hypothetical protein [Thermoplasma volcanium GSS1]|uniref:CN hydrolase domain-containing protein n=1 Tax=Thermoplasma volcanium (strain ATCC 51530 / DSM 4299 / JCM 9571 / NBRC 15438 / GSS1) TaxID=273116 RepID=Q97A06_THEVO|nr:carbon-nitrogen hydrolase family protein [Thermoplasma volcanium]BAB60146.1 hypothetical protein [Thermoplasma volcanium GSS1]
MNELSITAVQLHRQHFEDGLAYLEKVIDAKNSDFLVLPEKWSTEVMDQQAVIDLIKDSIVSKFNIAVPGSFSIKENGFLYNRAYIFHTGKLIGYQDKISLYGNEGRHYNSGSEIRIFRKDDLRIGIAICYDIDFPYYPKLLAKNKADIIANPSLIRSIFSDEWHLYVSARSLENRIPVLSVNSLSDPYKGKSIFSHPYEYQGGGKLRLEIFDDEAFTVTLNKKDFTELRDRRINEDPGVYSGYKVNIVDF